MQSSQLLADIMRNTLSSLRVTLYSSVAWSDGKNVDLDVQGSQFCHLTFSQAPVQGRGQLSHTLKGGNHLARWHM